MTSRLFANVYNFLNYGEKRVIETITTEKNEWNEYNAVISNSLLKKKLKNI